MNQKNKNRINIYLLIGAALVLSIVHYLVLPRGFLLELREVLSPFEGGRVIGHILGGAVFLIIISLIGAIAGYFSKNSKRWWLIWIIFLIVSIWSFVRLPDQIIREETEVKKQLFTRGCVKGMLKKQDIKDENFINSVKLSCNEGAEVFYACKSSKGTDKECLDKSSKVQKGYWGKIIEIDRKKFTEGCIKGTLETLEKSDIKDEDFMNSVKSNCNKATKVFFECKRDKGTDKECIDKLLKFKKAI